MKPNGLRIGTPGNHDGGDDRARRIGPAPRRIFVPRVPPARLMHDAHAGAGADADNFACLQRPASPSLELEDILRVLLPPGSSPKPSCTHSRAAASAAHGIEADDACPTPPARQGCSTGPTRRSPAPWPVPAAAAAPSEAWVKTVIARISSLDPAEARQFFCEHASGLPESVRQRIYPSYAEQLMRSGHFKQAGALCRHTLGYGSSTQRGLFTGGVAYHELNLREHAQVLILESIRARQSAGETLTLVELVELHDLESGSIRLAKSSPFFERFEACLLKEPKVDLSDAL